MTQNVVDLAIPDDCWEETGVGETPEELEARLLATVHINGVPHHLEAFHVTINNRGEQEATDLAFEGNVGAIGDVSEPDGHWQTVTIRGKEYVLAMTPFC